MIFYFTGTGNSLYAAKTLDDNTISIPQIVNSDTLDFADDKIGIVCPIYGHEMPQMVKEFIARATFNTDYLYIVLTYGKRHANAVELADVVLKKADKQADYITTLLMVDNFLPKFDMTEETKLDKKVEEQLLQIKTEVKSSKRGLQKVTAQDKAVHEMYLKSVNNIDETIWSDFTVTDDCIGCGICAKVCPSGCIRLEKQKANHIGSNCQACYACIHACPKLAIRLKIPEKNLAARYRNPHISICDIVKSNNQTEN